MVWPPSRCPFDPPGSCGAADSVGVQTGDVFPPDSSRSGLVKSPRTLTNSSSRSWPPDRPRCVQPVIRTPRNRSISKVWSGSAKLPWNTVENPARAAIGQKSAKVQEVCDKSGGSCPPDRVVRGLHATPGVRDGSGRLGVRVGAHETGDCRCTSRCRWRVVSGWSGACRLPPSLRSVALGDGAEAGCPGQHEAGLPERVWKARFRVGNGQATSCGRRMCSSISSA